MSLGIKQHAPTFLIGLKNKIMQITSCFDGDDFAMNKMTIIAEHENLRVIFKVDNSKNVIGTELHARLIFHKAIKRINNCLKAYPLGGVIRYPL